MKLPAVTIAATFICGIVLGLCPPLARMMLAPQWIVGAMLATALMLVFGLRMTATGRLAIAGSASLLIWLALGILGAAIAQQPLPVTHITRLVAEGKIDLHSPLRWHGRLRDEPTALPWGTGYEIELTAVEYQGVLLPTSGGLRLSFASPRTTAERPALGAPAERSLPSDAEQLPLLHAGDEVAVLAQAKRPQVFKDEGTFDRRAYLEQQNIHLTASLRSPELLERVAVVHPTMETRLARARRRLREEIDMLFGATPQVAGVLRAMLLGDRTFVDREEAAYFQKTGAFHVLAVAGLHVGALAAFLFLLARKLKFSPMMTITCTLLLLFAYVAIVEQRSPVLRAALMATLVALGGFFYRRLELLNSAALAALLLLIWRPLAIRDSSFQLTFLAIGCIAGLAAPWLEKTVQPYARALRGWRDVTRDAAHEPKVIQFRIDLRSAAKWSGARLPKRFTHAGENAVVAGVALSLGIWELLIVTLVLQIGMLPLMAGSFHRITLSAPLANLLAVPLTGIIVPLGFVTLGCGLLFSWAGKLLAIPLKFCTLFLLHSVQWLAGIPRLSYRIPGPKPWLVLLFFTVLGLLLLVLRFPYFQKRGVLFALSASLAICSILIAIFPFAPTRAAGKLEMTVLDVGQGDSLFVISPKGGTLLIDGGGAFTGFPGHEEQQGIDPGEDAVSPYLWSRGFQKIDAVALTHAHQDHIGGLTAILQNFQVGRLWIGKEVASPALARLEALANAKHIPIEHEIDGMEFPWGGVDGKFFWPEVVNDETPQVAKNNDSLVLRLHYGQRTLLLTGDAEKESERRMLRENDAAALQADVLKVGHHGSKNSTMPEFLQAVRPSFGIISAGAENSYGHPHPELLERLQAAGVRILRTDRDGAVHVLTDGKSVQVWCFVACSTP